MDTEDILTPDWMTDCLQKKGFLASGRVKTVTKTKVSETRFSRLSYLRLEFSGDAPVAAPKCMFLKRSASQAGRREVEFYKEISPCMLNPPIPRCFDASFSRKEQSYYLLLEDLSETHCVTEFPLPPILDDAESIVDVLAEFHAFWWDHPRLGEEIGEFPTKSTVEHYIEKVAAGLPRLVDFLGDRLSVKHRKLYEWALAEFSSLVGRRMDVLQDFTFIHGDGHAWNFLLPRDKRKDRTIIIDWYTQSTTCRCWTAAADLASLIVPWWNRRRRSELEEALLRRYVQRLDENGISYGWDRLWFDYRLSAIRCLFIPINEVGRVSVSRWLPHLENALDASDDLNLQSL